MLLQIGDHFIFRYQRFHDGPGDQVGNGAEGEHDRIRSGHLSMN